MAGGNKTSEESISIKEIEFINKNMYSWNGRELR